jgi:hypothetical protein
MLLEQLTGRTDPAAHRGSYEQRFWRDLRTRCRRFGRRTDAVSGHRSELARWSRHSVDGSGAVVVEGVAGVLTVKTSSGSFNASGVGSSLRVRTQSGAVDAALTGTGDVDVETGSSAIRLRGLRGRRSAKTQSGRITAQGKPGGEWVTGSSGVDLDIEAGVGYSVDASSRSGSPCRAGAYRVPKRNAR